MKRGPDGRAQPSFILRGEWAPVISAMSTADAGTLLRAMYAHAGHGTMPEIPDSLALTWTLVSATMDADHARWNRTCEARRAAGQKGGTAKAARQKEKTEPETDQTDHKKAEQPAELPAEQPEREKDGLEAAAEPSLAYLAADFRAQKLSPAAVSGFCRFYRTFPRHVGPRDAVKAYGRAISRLVRGGLAEAAAVAAIEAGAVRYAAEQKGTEQRFIAHPASWLNAGRWADEPAAAPSGRVAGRGGRLAAIARAAGLCGEDEVAEVPALEEASHD